MEKGSESFILEVGSQNVDDVVVSKTKKIEKYFSREGVHKPEIVEDYSFKGSRKEAVEKKKNTDETFTAEEIGKIRQETADMELEIKKLEEAYADKKDQNKGFFKKFRIIPGSLGESANEEEGLRLKLMVKKMEAEDNKEKIQKFERRLSTMKRELGKKEKLPASVGGDPERDSAVMLEKLTGCINENAAIFGKKWEGIRGMNVYLIIRDMNWRKDNEMDAILRKLQETLDEDVRPGGLETLENWLGRLSKLASEKGK